MELNKQYEANIWKFYLYKFLNSIELTVPIFTLFFLANNLTMVQFMSLETIYIILVLILEVPSGAFADLFGRKLSISIEGILCAMGFMVLGLSTTYFGFLMGQVLLAFSAALRSGADSALIYDTLKGLNKEKSFSKIYGKSSFIATTCWAVCALIGGYLAPIIGYRPLFLITAGIFSLAFLVTLLFKEPKNHDEVYEKNYIKHLKESIKFSLSHRVIRNLLIYYSFFGAAGHMAWFIIQPFYEQSALPKYFVGIAVSCFFIASSIGNYFSHKIIDKYNNTNLLLGLITFSSIALIMTFFVSKLFALVFIIVLRFMTGVRNVFVDKEINEHTKSSQRATVLSVKHMSKSVMYAVLAPLVGLIVDIYTPAAAFLMLGVGLSIFAIYFLILSFVTRKDIL